MSAAHSRGQVPLSLITDSIPEAVLRGYGTPVRAIGHELHLFACRLADYVALDSTMHMARVYQEAPMQWL